MDLLQETNVACPYCGEINHVLIDTSIPEQHYIEDCQVCCRPIVYRARCEPHALPQLEARREDDA